MNVWKHRTCCVTNEGVGSIDRKNLYLIDEGVDDNAGGSTTSNMAKIIMDTTGGIQSGPWQYNVEID